MSVEQRARLIIDGTEARWREIVTGAKGKLGPWLELIAPSLVNRVAVAALARSQR